MDLRQIGWGGMDWTDLALDRVLVEDSCEYGNETMNSIKF
jgi:hypothetical protein